MSGSANEQFVIEQFVIESSLEVGYIIAYDDGRLDRYGKFPLLGQAPEPFSIFKKMVELEPTIREATYIFGTIRLPQNDTNPATIEYKKAEIGKMLNRLQARPGIIRRVQLD